MDKSTRATHRIVKVRISVTVPEDETVGVRGKVRKKARELSEPKSQSQNDSKFDRNETKCFKWNRENSGRVRDSERISLEERTVPSEK